jgi:membrane fusion protein, multidrug efflux system
MALKKIHTVIAVLGLAIAGGAAWWWQNMRPAPPVAAAPAQPGGPSPPGRGRRVGRPGRVVRRPWRVGRVEVATLVDDVQAVGSLRSRQGVMLRPEVSGRIARLGFTDGQRVQRGQLLVQLDDTLQQAQLQQAAGAGQHRAHQPAAQPRAAGAELRQPERGRPERGRAAGGRGAGGAGAGAARAHEGAGALRRHGRHPQVDVGDYVKDGADIVNLEDLSQMSVEFRLPERYVGRCAPGCRWR